MAVVVQSVQNNDINEWLILSIQGSDSVLWNCQKWQCQVISYKKEQHLQITERDSIILLTKTMSNTPRRMELSETG